MPAGDSIFVRLRSATDAEIAAIARSLKVSEAMTGDREVDVVRLSKEYRSAAGHSVANLFRDEHALAYREVLLDVVAAAREAAGWRHVDIKDTAREEWLEEYTFQATCFAADPRRSAMSDVEKAEARDRAEAALEGRMEQPSSLIGTAVGLGALGAGAAVLAFMASTPTLLIMGSLSGVFPLMVVMGPAMKKVLPATMVLIQTRKRLEFEAVLKDVQRSAA